MVVHLLRSEQKRGESGTAWSEGLEDFVGGSCEGAVDSCIGEPFQMIDWKATAPKLAAGREGSVQAVRESGKFKCLERGNAGQAVLTKLLALFDEAQDDWGSYEKRGKATLFLPKVLFDWWTRQSQLFQVRC